MDARALGKEAEQQAEKYLLSQGLKTLCCNFNCRGGEIDLIMLERSTLVFIEVRRRLHHQYGNAAESVNFTKQRKIIHAAEYFLLKNPRWASHNCRFDVIAYDGNTASKAPLWYKDAFRI
ncbi:YraN family protein [Marinobacterium jannaschii]|uniref:YraN family protein n=1 Tax=Marinobacterium jannaschii TaxID=64970 RepID=UPI000480EA86|nr:YraN family protein [Marinobacterium jannaschii]